jgi:hypothetical protein
MSAPVGDSESERACVDWLWRKLNQAARLVRVLWPWRNSPAHIVAAQFELEVERVRHARAEKGGRV